MAVRANPPARFHRAMKRKSCALSLQPTLSLPCANFFRDLRGLTPAKDRPSFPPLEHRLRIQFSSVNSSSCSNVRTSALEGLRVGQALPAVGSPATVPYFGSAISGFG